MNPTLEKTTQERMSEAASQLQEAANARKCWGCGCLHDTLEAIGRVLPQWGQSGELNNAIDVANERLVSVRYDCLGCDVCYPAVAANALEVAVEPCPNADIETRNGWPPLPGDYVVCRYQAPVAVCTLNSDDLLKILSQKSTPGISIIGSLRTENLGIERMIENIIANPNIRFLVLCGDDTRKAVGHMPGQSLLALTQSGIDENGRVIGACGKRPVLKNLARVSVEHFRQTVEVVDLIGQNDISKVIEVIRNCTSRNPGSNTLFKTDKRIEAFKGHLPERMTLDSAGYFVIYVDNMRGIIVLEHYRNDGTVHAIIEGRQAAELYTTAIEKQLISRLDHAAYLGRELARAERTLATNDSFVQDGAPERGVVDARINCACGTPCEGE